MIELPVTPLQPVPDYFGRHAGGPRVFLKREDLLPFGGGNKVRRFLCWLQERSDKGQLAGSRVAALSDRGAHTFLVLARMAASGRLPVRSLLFWERATASSPYSEKVRQGYLDRADVKVHSGGLLSLLLRYAWARLFRRTALCVLGIGGSARTVGQPYRGVFLECTRQLAEHGHETVRTWHVFPIASGNMADGFLRTMREESLRNHRLIGVLTGPMPSRLWVRLRYALETRLSLLRLPRMKWRQFQEMAASFHRRTGVWVDPNHAIYAALALDRLPSAVGPKDAVVLWITCPRL